MSTTTAELIEQLSKLPPTTIVELALDGLTNFSVGHPTISSHAFSGTLKIDYDPSDGVVQLSNFDSIEKKEKLTTYMVTVFSEEICIENNNEMTEMIQAHSPEEAFEIMKESLVASFGFNPENIILQSASTHVLR